AIGGGIADPTLWKWLRIPIVPGDGDGAQIGFSHLDIILSGGAANYVQLVNKREAAGEGVLVVRNIAVPLTQRLIVQSERAAASDDALFVGLDSLSGNVLTLARITRGTDYATLTPFDFGDLTSLLNTPIVGHTPATSAGTAMPVELTGAELDSTG